MAITQSAETILANIDTIPVMSGQVIYVRDAQQLYFDSLNGTRVQIRDVIFLDTDAQRTAIVAPLEKLYFVKATGVLWAYNDGWVAISGGAAQRYTASIMTWSGSTAPYTYTITAATHGKGTEPIVQCTNNGGEIVSLGVRIATNGDVTLYTNEKLIAYVTII